MPVETIECQIVQAQLGRYLSGEAISDEALRQLEDHIGGCPICRQEVAIRRASLQALLGTVNSAAGRPEALIGALRQNQFATHAVVESPTPEAPATTPKPTPAKLSRPLLLGSALALVLVAMSYLGNNPTSLFGDRASEVRVTPAPIESTSEIPATATPELIPTEPLTLEAWTALGLDGLMPYDSADAQTFADWEWLTLAEAYGPEPAAEPETASTGDLEDWELFGLGLNAQPASEAAVAPEPETTTANTPAARPRPRVQRPVRRAAPSNTIRVYAPGQ